jgi:hypothetical protein
MIVQWSHFFLMELHHPIELIKIELSTDVLQGEVNFARKFASRMENRWIFMFFGS